MLKCGVIGAGIISKRHLDALKRHPMTEVAAIADLDRAKALQAAEAYGAAAYTDYKEMLEQERLDMVIINLPHALHEESSLLCAQKGIHVLLEKPMSVSAASCQRITRAFEEAGLVLQIGHVQRYFPENKKAKELILSGRFGKLVMIEDVRTSLYFTPGRPAWFLKKELSGGGIMMNLGAHSLDKIMYLTDSHIKEIHGYCGCDMPGCGVEGRAQALLQTESGIPAAITLCGYNDVPVNETTLYCTNGVIKLSTGTGLEVWNGSAFEEVECSRNSQPFDEQLFDFVQAVEGKRRPVTDGRYSGEIVGLIEQIYGQNEEGFDAKQ